MIQQDVELGYKHHVDPVKEELFMTLVKDDKEEFIREVPLQWSLAVGKRDQAQLQIQQEQAELYGQEAGGLSGWKITKKKRQEWGL